MQWINDLKIAVVENDTRCIGELIQHVPNFEDLEEAKEALALIQMAIVIVDEEKTQTMEIMKKIKQTKEFLQNQ